MEDNTVSEDSTAGSTCWAPMRASSRTPGSRVGSWAAGVAYGYTWILGLHWNLEMEVGFGYSYTRYDRFRCSGCGKKVETNRPHHYVGPTKAAINLVYVF